ncbi:MAG: MlaE family lipid ABC transporter permease subunit [Rhizobiaceae bacterium]|nr:MlaE family lipid ABC transporter permease subunit [Rhizobiaceae bacterium]
MFTNGNDGASATLSADTAPPAIEARGGTIRLAGTWTTSTVADVDAQMRALESSDEAVTLDLSAISRMDTAGAWLVHRLTRALDERGLAVTMAGADEDTTVLLQAVDAAEERDQTQPERPRRWSPLDILENLGRSMHAFARDGKASLNILGATIRGAQMKLGRRRAVNPASVTTHIDRMGIGAVPVIVLMSFIVGAIIAQQGAFQLRFFGAEIFVVNLVGILVLRELGVLMTAIMVAGRTGSAITAEIGSMKMREEVDALTVIGLNPIGVLVFPRLVALIIVIPCLTVIANFAALAGAMVIAQYYSGISPEAFIDRLRGGIDLSTIFAGLIKAPFMALIIGIIASVEGLKVEGSAESLGRHVTASVVKAIFVVIVVDGFFAVFYAAIDF